MCRHPIPASPPSATPVPRVHSCPSSRWSPLRCGHRRATERLGLYQTQPLNLPLGAPRRAIISWLGSRTWVWCLPARSRLCERTNEVFVLPLLVVGRDHPSLRPMRSLAPERRPFDDRADDRTVGSIVKGHVPKREGPTTDVGTPPLASPPFRRRASLRRGVSGRYEPRVRCRLRASATVIRASHLCGDLPGRMRRGGASCSYHGARGLRVRQAIRSLVRRPCRHRRHSRGSTPERRQSCHGRTACPRSSERRPRKGGFERRPMAPRRGISP